VKGPLTGKDPDAGKEEGEEGITEDEMVGWHHRLNEQEFEQIPGGCKGQGSRELVRGGREVAEERPLVLRL